MRFDATFVALAIFLSSAIACPAKEVQVKEYTRKDGKVIKAHTREVKDKDEKKAAAKEETKEVKGYTKKDGTVVKGYTRKKSTKKS